jgi:DNA polymerase-3 subunit delta'
VTQLNIYPWQQTNWQQLSDRVKNNCLPHALLLVGDNGVGKKQFATAFASALFCDHFQKTGVTCGNCHSCALSQANTHPDLMRIESEPGHAIKIDQIRDLSHFINQTALLNGYRVIIVSPATAMNNNAANALLKTLEEPTPKTLLLLISDLTLRLPATVLSRCQKIVFQSPTLAQGLTWLQENMPADKQFSEAELTLGLNLTNGAPLAALELLNNENALFRLEFYQRMSDLIENRHDPIELAEGWKEKNPTIILDLLFSLVQDLLRLKTLEQPTIINHDIQPILAKIGQKLSLAQLLRYSDYMQTVYAYRREGSNLNSRLLLEEILIKWTQHVAC